jgi:ribosomal protein S18 acetylase RimI-like enzyme
MNLSIREARPEDAFQVTELVRLLARNEGEESPITEADVLSFLSFPGAVVLLAEEGGEVLGMLSYVIRPNLYHGGLVGLIDELVVYPRARGRGVGSALIQAVVSRCAASGCREISVSTMPDNTRALAFYRRHGFTDEAILLERHFAGET